VAYETILYEVNEGVGRITLNRPDKFNSFTETMHREMQDALKQAERDAAVRCLVLTGAGRAFCAGQDLDEARARTAGLGDAVRRYYNPLILKLRSIDKPVLAAVNGAAAGAGASLALACDLIYMSEKAYYMLAFVKVGLVPDSGASYWMPRLIGYHRAMELALTGDRLSAERALELGLCNRVVPQEQLDAAVGEMAARLAKGPRSMGLTKRQMHRGMWYPLDEVLEYEAYMQETAGKTEDAREGVQAFAEKREPRFQGR
jgi:2-(1,2-epoxy-1,2-dihydrophenyl)acetyl-CoA isomerase